MFGFRNFIGFGIARKIGNFSLEFTAGLIEEVTFNVTSSVAANAAASSKVVTSNLVGLIKGATPNLLL